MDKYTIGIRLNVECNHRKSPFNHRYSQSFCITNQLIDNYCWYYKPDAYHALCYDDRKYVYIVADSGCVARFDVDALTAESIFIQDKDRGSWVLTIHGNGYHLMLIWVLIYRKP